MPDDKLKLAILPPKGSGTKLPKREKPLGPVDKIMQAILGAVGIEPSQEDYASEDVYNDALAYNGLGGLTDLPLGGLAGAAGVTTFLKNGIPDVAKRALATEKAMGKLKQSLGKLGTQPTTADQILTLAQRYPRVMAHNVDINTAALDDGVAGANYPAMNWFSPQIGRSEITLSTKANPTDHVGQTFFHELGHTAQRIGKKADMTDMYNDYNDAVGYMDNPFEISARSIGSRAVDRMYGATPKQVRRPEMVKDTAPLIEAITRLKAIGR